MFGVIVVLIASLAWAGSSTLLKYLSSRIDALSVNTMRLWVGAVVLIVLVLISGRSDGLFQAHLMPVLMVAASGILAIAIGDTVYIKSLSYIDVSRAYPISQSTFPVLTLIVAVLFLGETFAWFNMVGAALVLCGILLIAKNARRQITPKSTGKGIALSLLAAVFWASGSIALKIGLAEIDPILAAAIRVTASALILTTVAFGRTGNERLNVRAYSSRNLILVASAGILTYGIGAIGYATAIQLLGAGKAALLSTSAPIFLLPLSVLILKERPSSLALTGIAVSVAGICLVAL